MASINGGNDLDLSQLSPATREALGKVAFPDRLASFTPFLMLSWLDTFIFGAPWSRYIVYWVMTVITTANIYYQVQTLVFFAQGFGHYSGFFEATWGKVEMLLGNAVRIPAMSFYLYRAYVLVGRRIWIVCLTALPIAYTGVAALAPLWMVKMMPYNRAVRKVLCASSGCEVFADSVITLTIAWQLYKSRTGWSLTDRMISKLLFTLAETQTPPTLMALITLILFYATPNSTGHALMICSPKITCLCIMLTLISRVRITQEEARRRAALPPGTSITAEGSRTGKSSRSEGDHSGSMLFAYAPPSTTVASAGDAEKGEAEAMVGGKILEPRSEHEHLPKAVDGKSAKGIGHRLPANQVQSVGSTYDFPPAQIESQVRPLSIRNVKRPGSIDSMV